jgi:hypothetical protein
MNPSALDTLSDAGIIAPSSGLPGGAGGDPRTLRCSKVHGGCDIQFRGAPRVRMADSSSLCMRCYKLLHPSERRKHIPVPPGLFALLHHVHVCECGVRVRAHVLEFP